jgi:hypothetical protein
VTVPDPTSFEVAVSSDPLTRTLVVQVPQRTGHDAVLWRTSVRAQLDGGVPDGSAAGWEEYCRSAALRVWGHVNDRRQVCQGVPQEDGTVQFRFERGDPTYKQVVSIPGLTAIATIDRANGGKIVGVRFRGRR